MKKLEQFKRMYNKTYLYKGREVKILSAHVENDNTLIVVTDKKVITRSISNVNTLLREFLPMARQENDQDKVCEEVSDKETVVKFNDDTQRFLEQPSDMKKDFLVDLIEEHRKEHQDVYNYLNITQPTYNRKRTKLEFSFQEILKISQFFGIDHSQMAKYYMQLIAFYTKGNKRDTPDTILELEVKVGGLRIVKQTVKKGVKSKYYIQKLNEDENWRTVEGYYNLFKTRDEAEHFFDYLLSYSNIGSALTSKRIMQMSAYLKKKVVNLRELSNISGINYKVILQIKDGNLKLRPDYYQRIYNLLITTYKFHKVVIEKLREAHKDMPKAIQALRLLKDKDYIKQNFSLEDNLLKLTNILPTDAIKCFNEKYVSFNIDATVDSIESTLKGFDFIPNKEK